MPVVLKQCQSNNHELTPTSLDLLIRLIQVITHKLALMPFSDRYNSDASSGLAVCLMAQTNSIIDPYDVVNFGH